MNCFLVKYDEICKEEYIDYITEWENNNEEIVAVITAAICAMGYSSDRIASIRPSVSKGWKFDGRLSGRM